MTSCLEYDFSEIARKHNITEKQVKHIYKQYLKYIKEFLEKNYNNLKNVTLDKQDFLQQHFSINMRYLGVYYPSYKAYTKILKK